MSFSTHIFSTTASIASIEKNINKLAGTKSVQSILGNNTDTMLVVSSEVSYAVLTDNNKNEIKVTAVSERITIPAVYITEAKTYTSSDELLETYYFTTGYGSRAYGLTNDVSIEIENADWQVVPEKSSWVDKIEKAKITLESVLKNYLKTDFSENGRYSYDYNYYFSYAVSNDIPLLDIISNLDIFNLASDYLVLSMCFKDLATGGYNSQYAEKAETYYTMYQNELSESLKLVDIDINDDGNTDIEYYDKTNRIIV